MNLPGKILVKSGGLELRDWMILDLALCGFRFSTRHWLHVAGIRIDMATPWRQPFDKQMSASIKQQVYYSPGPGCVEHLHYPPYTRLPDYPGWHGRTWRVSIHRPFLAPPDVQETFVLTALGALCSAICAATQTSSGCG